MARRIKKLEILVGSEFSNGHSQDNGGLKPIFRRLRLLRSSGYVVPDLPKKKKVDKSEEDESGDKNEDGAKIEENYDVETKGDVGENSETVAVNNQIADYALENKAEEAEERKRETRRMVFKVAGAVLGGAIALGSFGLNIYQRVQNIQKDKTIAEYQQNEIDLNQNILDLQALNQGGVERLEETLSTIKRRIPIEKIFFPYEELAWGMKKLNSNLVYSLQLEDIAATAAGLPSSPSQIFNSWEVSTHGLLNYIFKNSEIIPPFIGRTKETVVEDNQQTVITQEVGRNTYVAIIGEGNHLGNDLINKVGGNLFASFKGRVTFDGLYEGHGRLISIMADKKYDEYFYRMNLSHLREGTKRWAAGQTINIGDYIATIGSTGFATGPHLHVEFWRSKTGRSGTWELYDPFGNKTYLMGDDENLVWFYTWNIPEELRAFVAEKVGKK